jgi:hypothetical protein
MLAHYFDMPYPFPFTIRRQDTHTLTHTHPHIHSQIGFVSAFRTCVSPHPAFNNMMEAGPAPRDEDVFVEQRVVLSDYKNIGHAREMCAQDEKLLLDEKFANELNAANRLPMLVNGKMPGAMLTMREAWMRMQQAGMYRQNAYAMAYATANAQAYTTSYATASTITFATAHAIAPAIYLCHWLQV